MLLLDVKFATQIAVNFPAVSPRGGSVREERSEIYDKKLQKLFDINPAAILCGREEEEKCDRKLSSQQKCMI